MKQLNVAMIGYKFMGRAHANAWRQAPRFFELKAKPVLKLLCGRSATDVENARQNLGFEEAETDWEKAVARPDIDIVDICVPGHLHHAVAMAAARHGKAILCEKPLANTLSEAEEMRHAVGAAGVVAMLCHNYRRLPAVMLAKQIVENGQLGRIHHFRGTYLQDWLSDPSTPMNWRLQKDAAGSGALGDLCSHQIDLARFLVGDLAQVFSTQTTFVTARPTGSGDATASVEVDDAVSMLLRFVNGAVGSIEASRVATGRKNQNRFEINGSRGSLVFDLEKLNELELYEEQGANSGFRTILATDPAHPFAGNWWPPGHLIGYEHSFTHTVAEFVDAVAEGRPVAPSFADGVAVQAVLDAAMRSCNEGRWVLA